MGLAGPAWASGWERRAFSFQGELFLAVFEVLAFLVKKYLDVCFGGLGFWGWTGGEGGRMKC